MSRVDTAWLRMDNDVNLMMIVGVWLLTPAITLDALRERIETDKLLKYERFRQKAVVDAMGAMWVEDDRLRHRPPRGAERCTEEAGQSERAGPAAAPVANWPPPRSTRATRCGSSTWSSDYEGGSALIARIHHCIGDGIALISVMNSITDGGNDPPKRRAQDEVDDDGDHDWLSDAVLKPLTDLATKAIGMYGSGVARSHRGAVASRSSRCSAHWTWRAPAAGGERRGRAGADARRLAHPLKGKPVGRKVVAWSEPMPLDEVKAIGKALNCSVNDVLLSCVAGAIGGYLRGAGRRPRGKEIRAMVPVNLRPLEKAWQLGNRFGLAPLVLPIGIANPVERVYAVRQRMNELKGSYQPLLAFAVLAVAGLFIKPVQDACWACSPRRPPR
jgi:diacylglycerol O-acyltransferase